MKHREENVYNPLFIKFPHENEDRCLVPRPFASIHKCQF